MSEYAEKEDERYRKNAILAGLSLANDANGTRQMQAIVDALNGVADPVSRKAFAAAISTPLNEASWTDDDVGLFILRLAQYGYVVTKMSDANGNEA
jgi:hypothetical protein